MSDLIMHLKKYAPTMDEANLRRALQLAAPKYRHMLLLLDDLQSPSIQVPELLPSTEEAIKIYENVLGYLIYVWDRQGSKMIPTHYTHERDFRHYINYYNDPGANKALHTRILGGPY